MNDVVLFALIEGIRRSVNDNSGWDGPEEHFKDILRLTDAMENVLCGLPIGGDNEQI